MGQRAKGWFARYDFGARRGTGVLYLTHTIRGEVLKTTLDGKVLWRLGTPKLPKIYAKKNEYHPTSVAVASSAEFFVADGYGKSVILHYSKDRKLLGTFGGWGGKPGQMRVPHGLYIDRYAGKEELLVADRENTVCSASVSRGCGSIN
ncbi:MAG: hypothetical protein V3W41_09215 [Planctomycetota bacterium]